MASVPTALQTVESFLDEVYVNQPFDLEGESEDQRFENLTSLAQQWAELHRCRLQERGPGLWAIAAPDINPVGETGFIVGMEVFVVLVSDLGFQMNEPSFSSVSFRIFQEVPRSSDTPSAD